MHKLDVPNNKIARHGIFYSAYRNQTLFSFHAVVQVCICTGTRCFFKFGDACIRQLDQTGATNYLEFQEILKPTQLTPPKYCFCQKPHRIFSFLD